MYLRMYLYIHIFEDGAVAAASIWCVLRDAKLRVGLGQGGEGERHEQGGFLDLDLLGSFEFTY